MTRYMITGTVKQPGCLVREVDGKYCQAYSFRRGEWRGSLLAVDLFSLEDPSGVEIDAATAKTIMSEARSTAPAI